MTQDSFKEFVLDQLHGLDHLSCRAMFGGHGLYRGNRFFGIIFKGRLYLKTTDVTRGEYQARGMKPFRPNSKQTLREYYEVPEDVLDDPEALRLWVGKAAAS